MEASDARRTLSCPHIRILFHRYRLRFETGFSLLVQFDGLNRSRKRSVYRVKSGNISVSIMISSHGLPLGDLIFRFRTNSKTSFKRLGWTKIFTRLFSSGTSCWKTTSFRWPLYAFHHFAKCCNSLGSSKRADLKPLLYSNFPYFQPREICRSKPLDSLPCFAYQIIFELRRNFSKANFARFG